MPRQTFFSFHYFRVNVVRNSNAFRSPNEQSFFFDHSLWESVKRQGDDALKRLIDDGLRGSSVVAVLIGA